MRVRFAALFLFIFALAWGAPAHAAVSEPFAYSAYLIGVHSIPNTPYGTFQTAIRAGDTPTLQVFVHSKFGTMPIVSADLSDFGFSDSATTTGEWAGYAAKYYPAYFYNFSHLSASTTPDGVYEIPIIATDQMGSTSSMTMSIRVDNVLPTISLSNIAFDSDSPQKFDPIYLSGSANGTGSAIKVATIDQKLIDASGKTMPYGYSSTIATSNINALNGAIASSTDGTFTQAPIQLFWGDDSAHIENAASLRVDLLTYDESGFFATTTLTVPIPKPDPCIAVGNCVSNVLFLPGIEGSRLYEGQGANCTRSADEKLWEPVEVTLGGIWSAIRGAGDDKTKGLFLDQTGASSCSTVYTKTGDIIDAVGGGDIYKSLIDEMNGLKSDSTIKDWEPIAYDWRLSLDDLLNKGAEHDGKIFYQEATSTPYIEQTLRSLAASSKTGKVNIVAHSNGGLVAKALLNRLGGESASLVDKVIMVGAPQSGAPEALGITLVGHNAGIYKFGFPMVSNAVAREFAQNSPMAYHLLPSASYLASIIDEPTHPVVHFTGDGFAQERAAYGNSIVDLPTLDDFLFAKHNEREKPATSDLLSAEVLNSALIDYANSTHTTLDAWTPPAGIEVSQIAGWGVDTVGGVDFYTAQATDALTALAPLRAYRPIFIEDGDGTVPVPSALLMSTSTANVKRYWLNLDSYRIVTSVRRAHGDIFEVPSLRDFIKNILKNSTSSLPVYISSSQPLPTTENKKLTFFLHSPLTLEITDSSGNATGLAEDGSIAQNIPDSSYGEFGEVKYVTVPQGSTYQLTMHGQDNGTFSLDMQESSGGVITNTSTIANVPTTASTLASLTISDGIDTASALTVDKNDDGNVFTITPKAGETVNYTPPRRSHWKPAPIVVASSALDEGPIATTLAVNSTQAEAPIEPIATSTEATTTEQVATTTMQIAQVEKKMPILITKAEEIVVSPRAKEASPSVAQTASVYDASQQPVFNTLGEVVYYSLHRLWTGLQRILHLKK